MSGNVRAEFELVGHYAGSNLLVNGHQFINGKYVFIGSPELAHNVTVALRFYRGYLVGSPEWEQAKREEESNGKRDTQEDEGEGQTEHLQGGVQPEGEGSPPEEAADSEQPVESPEGEEGSEDQGSGSEDAGDVSEQERKEVDTDLVNLIYALDPANDDHWNVSGLPSLSAIEEAYSPDVTRDDIEQAIPGYNRVQAAEEKAEEAVDEA